MFATDIFPRPASMRTLWASLLAAAALLGLLLAFGQVVRGAVRQGELRNRAHALALEATWRCNIQHERARREACLQRIDAVPRDSAQLRAAR